MPAAKKTAGKWSHEVTEHSDALALEPDVFKSDDPREIARSLKKSAEASQSASPSPSARPSLTFYINRAGKNLPQKRKKVLKRRRTSAARPGRA